MPPLRVRLVERGSPHSLPLMESGKVSLLCFFFISCCATLAFTWILWSSKILPGVRIIIANPETKGPMGESHLGEVRATITHRDVTLACKKVHHLTPLVCGCVCCVDLGAQRPQCQWILHRLRRRGAAVRPLQLQAELRGHADCVGSDRIPGLPSADRANRRQWR